LVLFLSHILKRSLILAVLIGFLMPSFVPAQEQQAGDDKGVETTNLGASGLPLPRFVSLRSGRVNVRVGPDRASYAIAWTYMRQGFPVEIIEEYDNWRRIRDNYGDGGWVDQAFLSGKRTAMPAPWSRTNLQSLRATPDEEGALVAEIEVGVIGDLRQCRQGWCELDIRAACDLIEPKGATGSSFMPQFLSELFSFGECSQNYRGWLKQNTLWGTYPGEEF